MEDEAATPLEPWPFRPSDAHAWPGPEKDADTASYAKTLSEAKLEVRKKRVDEEIAHAKAELDAELAIEHEYYKALIEVAKTSVDRTRAAAETVQKAAGAIITIYTGVLALSFSVSERPLPLRGLYAALLLGAAIVLSTGFVAYLPDPGTYDEADRAEEDGTTAESTPERLTNMFIKWTRVSSLDRVPWLRGSVIALGFGLVFLPAPFISGRDTAPPTSQTSWPTPDPAAGDNVKLQKVLYSAQVERAATKKEVSTEKTYDELWFLGFLVAAASVVLLPRRLPGSLAKPGPESTRRRAPNKT